MIVNLARRVGDNIVLERIDSPVTFEGGQAQEDVLITFPLEGSEVTARITKVLPHDPEGEPAIEVELVDQKVLDVASEVALSRLPAEDDFTTEI
jgi:hypothetical protein